MTVGAVRFGQNMLNDGALPPKGYTMSLEHYFCCTVEFFVECLGHGIMHLLVVSFSPSYFLGVVQVISN